MRRREVVDRMRQLLQCYAVIILMILWTVSAEGEVIGNSEMPEGISPEQYEQLRVLEDDPLDPINAGVDDFLDIPGFPPILAAKIAKLSKERGGKWMEGLNPGEKEELLRYRRWIDLSPGLEFGMNLRYSGRFREDFRQDRIYLTSETDNWDANLRARVSPDEKLVSALVRGRVMGESLRIFAGDFCPDIPLGLLSSAASFNYPFSGTFPLRNCRWVGRGTGFYGNSLRGAACFIKRRRLKALVFSGRMREYDFDYGPDLVKGAAVQFGYSGLAAGTAVMKNGGGYLTALHLKCTGDLIKAGFELVSNPDMESAWAGGIRFNKEAFAAGMLVYGAESGFRSSMGVIPGAGRSVSGERRGVEAVAGCRMAGGCYAAYAVGADLKRSSFDIEKKLSTGFKLEYRRRDYEARLEWKSSYSEKVPLVPYPSGSRGKFLRQNTVRSLISFQPCNNLRIRISHRSPVHPERGLMLYPLIRLEGMNDRIRADLGAVFHRTFYGEPSFYAYLPSIKGTYPWKRIRGDGIFATIRLRIKMGRLLMGMALAWESGERCEADTQISVIF